MKLIWLVYVCICIAFYWHCTDIPFYHTSRYSAFADLFCDAIKGGLPALQTQHPGLYFHKSAEYLVKRKEAYQQCYAQSPGQILDGNQLSNIFWSDFFGVRGTKLSEPMNEQQMIIMVQETEKSFNHSVSLFLIKTKCQDILYILPFWI